MSVFRLIVGLGNPGREYRDTRHNVGFMIVERLAADAEVKFQVEKAWQADVAKAGDTILCKPRTYMNLSGEAVRAVSDFHKVAPGEMLIVLDDMALPFGKLRLRRRGSSGGHNGLQSIIEHLGTDQVPRLRVGIGLAEPGGAIGHVLGRFALDEKAQLQETLQRAIGAVELAREEGLQSAMNLYNRSSDQL
jgi:PTH1 family peptidyl-tRNA hydrolase